MPHDLSNARRSRCAVLVGLQLPDSSEAELDSSLDELGRLATTLGLEPVARLTQRRPSTAAPAVLGGGKLRELARLTGGDGVVPSAVPAWRRRKPAPDPDPAAPAAVEDEGEEDGDGSLAPTTPADATAGVILFDHDLTPTQLRNLEGATGAEVLDRSAVILEIFRRHARSREARLQVEVARLQYLAPRLRAIGSDRDRQQGGIGGRGGAGESALELDRRRVRDRIAELRRELESIAREAAQRRVRRGAERTVALVGYTNAGKSSLMRALTGADVRIENKLFATLDPTVRLLQPETRPRILVSDTVGFIKKLPHDLVASFRSTLAEARDAALLLHVVDAADPGLSEQMAVTRSVLAELGAGDRPALLLLNQADRIDSARRSALAAEHPAAVLLSAFDAADIAALRARLVAWFERDMIEEEIFVGYDRQGLLREVYDSGRVLEVAHEDGGTRVRVRAPADALARLRTQAGQAMTG